VLYLHTDFTTLQWIPLIYLHITISHGFHVVIVKANGFAIWHGAVSVNVALIRGFDQLISEGTKQPCSFAFPFGKWARRKQVMTTAGTVRCCQYDQITRDYLSRAIKSRDPNSWSWKWIFLETLFCLSSCPSSVHNTILLQSNTIYKVVSSGLKVHDESVESRQESFHICSPAVLSHNKIQIPQETMFLYQSPDFHKMMCWNSQEGKMKFSWGDNEFAFSLFWIKLVS
jgi:hypothetical protein